jgi:hypothetical protein
LSVAMIIRLLLMFSVLLSTSVLYGMGTELQFIDASELRKQDVYDEIPKTFGERVLIFPNGGRPDAVSFAFCESYDTLKSLIKKHFEKVASIREMTTDSQPKESKYGDESNRQFASREVAKLSAAGFRTDRYSEVQIMFPKYNIIDKGDQSSTLIMRLVNAQDIFGTPNAILTLIRRDDTLEQLRTFHLGIPLPKKEHGEIRIVTDTETKMIQELERSIQKESVGAILTITNGDPYASFDSLVKFQKMLDGCK